MIRLRQVKVSIYEEDKLLSKIESILKTKVERYSLIKKSLDARKKPELYYIYEVDVSVLNEKNRKATGTNENTDWNNRLLLEGPNTSLSR